MTTIGIMSETSDPQGNLRVTLRLHPSQVEMLDEINLYMPLGDRADVVRYLMNVGAQQLRFQQTVRQQADVIQRFGDVLSDDFQKLATSLEEVDRSKGQRTLNFAPAARPLSKAKRGAKKRSGSSSTGTK